VPASTNETAGVKRLGLQVHSVPQAILLHRADHKKNKERAASIADDCHNHGRQRKKKPSGEIDHEFRLWPAQMMPARFPEKILETSPAAPPISRPGKRCVIAQILDPHIPPANERPATAESPKALDQRARQPRRSSPGASRLPIPANVLRTNRGRSHPAANPSGRRSSRTSRRPPNSTSIRGPRF